MLHFEPILISELFYNTLVPGKYFLNFFNLILLNADDSICLKLNYILIFANTSSLSS